MKIVSLPWYDLEATRASLDRFWTSLRAALSCYADLPPSLNRELSLNCQWQHDELFLSQCCGLDLFTSVTEKAIPICRPVFENLNCASGMYYSYIVASSSRRDSRRDRLVANSPSSHSGYTTLLNWCRDEGLVGSNIHYSGSHQHSVQQIQEGKADYAAIDAHSWQYLHRAGIEIVAESSPVPSPPFITHQNLQTEANAIVLALVATMSDLGHEIGISDVIPCTKADYQSLAKKALLLTKDQ